jgi:hypothetical protein
LKNAQAIETQTLALFSERVINPTMSVRKASLALFDMSCVSASLAAMCFSVTVGAVAGFGAVAMASVKRSKT